MASLINEEALIGPHTKAINHSSLIVEPHKQRGLADLQSQERNPAHAGKKQRGANAMSEIRKSQKSNIAQKQPNAVPQFSKQNSR